MAYNQHIWVIKVVRTTITEQGKNISTYFEDKCFMSFREAAVYLVKKYCDATEDDTYINFCTEANTYSISTTYMIGDGDCVDTEYSIQIADIKTFDNE